MDLCYLDHNATTPIRPQARAAMIGGLALCGNPSSVHRAGRRARCVVEDARTAIAGLVGADPEAVILTSGGTEANNLAVRGSRRPVIAAATEHASVLGAPRRPRIFPVGGDGVVDLDALEEILVAIGRPALVCVMLANNETGVIQPVRAVAALAHRYQALVHCDAVQAVGKIPVQLSDLGVDLLSVSAHKFGGPMGVGALVVADGVRLDAMLRGGDQERRRRAGTENPIAIAGFGAAAAAVAVGGADEAARIGRLRTVLEADVRRRCPAATIIGGDAPRLPTTSCIAMPGVRAEVQLIRFDLAGIAVSAGSACSSGNVHRSHVLAAMGVGNDLAECAIRVSLGWTSRPTDVDRFVEVWSSIHTDVGARRAAQVPA